jgi:homoserine dehydrogenase
MDQIDPRMPQLAELRAVLAATRVDHTTTAEPHVVHIALLGFGSANQAFAKLLLETQSHVLHRRNLTIRCSGIFTRAHGAVWATQSRCIDLAEALAAAERGANLATTNVDVWVRRFAPDSDATFGTEQTVAALRELRTAGKCDAVLEAIVANYVDAEPAASFARFALSTGIHYITANKSPVALYYTELVDLAEQNGCKFRMRSLPPYEIPCRVG